MAKFRKIVYSLIALFIVFIVGWVFTSYYSFIFSRKVRGVIEDVERVDLNVALLQEGNQKINPQIFSFSVAIREPTGEIVTSSAEDRQWAVAKKGECVEAVFYPYPPWSVMKAGTYFNARLDRLSECVAIAP